MKTAFLLPAALILFCCGAQKPSEMTKVNFAMDNCPDNGDCTVELLKNKSLNIKKDDTGATYYQLLDQQGTNVIRYMYTKKTDPQLADAGYREELIFEVDAKNPETDLRSFDLQNTKLLFGRFCFCRGQTGYFPVTSGHLILKKSDDDYSIDLDFEVTEVPQIIKQVSIIAK